MNAPKVETRLRVSLLSLPSRSQAVLEYFFASTGQGSFQPSPEASADAAVFDFDNPDSRAHWDAFHQTTGKPGILLSMVAHPEAMTVWVKKPITPAAMLDAAARIQAGQWSTGEAPAAPEPALEPTPETPPEAAPLLASGATPETAPTNETPAASAEPAPVVAAAPSVTPTETVASPETSPAPAAPTPAAEPPARSTPSAAPRPRPPEVQESLWSWLWRALFDRRQPRQATSDTTSEVARTSAPVVATPETPAPTPSEAAPVLEPAPTLETSAAAPVPAPEAPAPEAPETAPIAEPALVTKSADAEEAPTPPPPPKIKPKASARELADAARYCGERDDIPETEFPNHPALYYGYGDHLISALREAYLVGAKWRAPTRLDLEFGAVTYVPTENRMYLDFSEDTLMAELVKPLPRRYKVRMVGLQEFADMQEHLAQAHRLDRFDAILWRLALETAKGRLPHGTNVTQEVFLRSWPNMTRFQPTPHAMRIAALWATRGASLLETARLLDIPQRYVFAFYNAAYTTDLVTDDGTRIRRAQRRSHKNQGAFSRLVNWLRG